VKVLLDSCIWGPVADELEEAGHEVEWVGSLNTDPGDEQVLRMAFRKQAVLITQDKDFGELAIVHGFEHSGIIRLVGFSARQQGAASLALLERFGSELREGAIVTASDQRVRVRPK